MPMITCFLLVLTIFSGDFPKPPQPGMGLVPTVPSRGDQVTAIATIPEMAFGAQMTSLRELTVTAGRYS